MGEAHVGGVTDEFLGGLAVGERTAAFLLAPAARSRDAPRRPRSARCGRSCPPVSPSRPRPSSRSRICRAPPRRSRAGARSRSPPGRISGAGACRRCRRSRTCRPRLRRRRAGRSPISPPVVPRGRIAWRRPSQPLKPPTTETRRAAGAQSGEMGANPRPRGSSRVRQARATIFGGCLRR